MSNQPFRNSCTSWTKVLSYCKEVDTGIRNGEHFIAFDGIMVPITKELHLSILKAINNDVLVKALQDENQG